MQKFYRKRTGPVEAIQWPSEIEEIMTFLGVAGADSIHGMLLVQTIAGPVNPKDGDWIVKEADGSFNVWRPKVFARVHELAED